MPTRKTVYELDDPDLPAIAYPLCRVWNVYPRQRRGYIKALAAAERLRKKNQAAAAARRQERLTVDGN